MGWECARQGMRSEFLWEPLGRKSGKRWEDSIKMDLSEIFCEDGIGSGSCSVVSFGISSIDLRVMLPQCLLVSNGNKQRIDIPCLMLQFHVTVQIVIYCVYGSLNRASIDNFAMTYCCS